MYISEYDITEGFSNYNEGGPSEPNSSQLPASTSENMQLDLAEVTEEDVIEEDLLTDDTENVSDPEEVEIMEGIIFL